jgi:hypothetical protein
MAWFAVFANTLCPSFVSLLQGRYWIQRDICGYVAGSSSVSRKLLGHIVPQGNTNVNVLIGVLKEQFQQEAEGLGNVTGTASYIQRKRINAIGGKLF